MAITKIDVTGVLIAVAMIGTVGNGIYNQTNGSEEVSPEIQSIHSNAIVEGIKVLASGEMSLGKDDLVNGRPIVFPPIPKDF